MKRVIRSEMIKLTTVRSVWVTAAAACGLSVFAVLGATPPETVRGPLADHNALFAIILVERVLMVILGIRSATDEHRYDTGTASLLADPNRVRFVAGKALVAGVAGVAVTAAAGATLVATMLIAGPGRGVELVLGGDSARTLTGFVLAGGLWATLGVALGTLIRSPIASATTALVWLMGLEDMVRAQLAPEGSWMPAHAGQLLAMAPTTRGVVTGAGWLIVWTGAALAAATMRTIRRDVLTAT